MSWANITIKPIHTKYIMHIHVKKSFQSYIINMIFVKDNSDKSLNPY